MSAGQRSSVSRQGLVDSWFGRTLVGWSAWALPLTILVVVSSLVFAPGTQRDVIYFLVLATAAVGLGVFAGNAGVLSFGHAGFVGLGAYVGAIFVMTSSEKSIAVPTLPGALADIHLPTPFALAATVLFVGVLALPVGFVVARMSPSAAVIGTFALLIIVNKVLVGAAPITRGNQTFFGVPPIATATTALVVLLVAILVARLHRESSSGLRLRASREDEMAAEVSGIWVARERLVAWVLSAMICGSAGALLGAFIGSFSPSTFFLTLSFQMLAMVLVGGWTTVSGAVVGAGVVVVMTRLLDTLATGPGPLPEFRGGATIGLSLVILIVLYFRREGLLGRREIDAWRPSALRAKWATDVPPADLSFEDDHAIPMRAHSLTMQGIEKAFSGVSVLRGVDIEIRSGEIVGVIGPNGSGKTTLVNIATGLLQPDAGQVRLDGAALQGRSARHIAQSGLARTFQGIKVFGGLTALENVQAAASAFDVIRSEEDSHHLLDLVGLGELADRDADTLSYGAQRRLEIARALAIGPTFLLLDEPAAGLDEDESDELLALLEHIRDRWQLGIFIIDHDLRLMLRLCDRIVAIDRGQVIAEGAPADVRSNRAVIRSYLGAAGEPIHTESED
ncbi:ATP-binding cassette domain-containing protein [Micromonospora sp. NPDC048830]|uniref:branched-chain amino acid ABC transporter ATP-binding protein/permease n=1 Tax=Micromonospora sp. NPDC048830 TaxID=3364257 RepID=UPI003721521A